jgi:hypothetical protein
MPDGNRRLKKGAGRRSPAFHRPREDAIVNADPMPRRTRSARDPHIGEASGPGAPGFPIPSRIAFGCRPWAYSKKSVCSQPAAR